MAAGKNGTAMERYSASEQGNRGHRREIASGWPRVLWWPSPGDLGAGKTAFVGGMAQGLGISSG